MAVVALATFLVTDRKRADQVLRESEEQWREVFEHNPVMYFMVNPTVAARAMAVYGDLG